MPHQNRVLNWQPHRRSSLDHHRKIKGALTGALTIVDLEAACPPVYDQGQEGSCTANAVTGAFELKERLNDRGADPGPVSRQAIYFWARRYAGNQGHDTGSTITDAMQAILDFGLPPESLWPYSEPLTREPSAAVYAEGLKRRPAAKCVARVKNDVAHLWDCLNSCDPVAGGFPVYSSFMTAQMANTGIWPGPQRGDKVVGGHAVCLVGYDPQMRRFKFRNSWSDRWGIRGYFWMPEAFVLSDFDDFMTVDDAPHLTPAQIPA